MRYLIVDHPIMGVTRSAIARHEDGKPTEYYHNDGNFWPLGSPIRCPKLFAGRRSAATELVAIRGYHNVQTS